MDCAQALSTISDNYHGKSNKNLMIRIKEFCSMKWHVILQKTPKEANVTAYKLVGAIQKIPYGSIRFTDILVDVEQVRFDGNSICSVPTLSL